MGLQFRHLVLVSSASIMIGSVVSGLLRMKNKLARERNKLVDARLSKVLGPLYASAAIFCCNVPGDKLRQGLPDRHMISLLCIAA